VTTADRLYHPMFGAEIQASETLIPDDPDGQVAATIDLMRRYVLEDSGSPAVRRDLQQALGGISAADLDEAERCRRIFSWVKGRISFLDDGGLSGASGLDSNPLAPVVEVLIRPRDMAIMCENGACQRVGDCDDFSMYTAALLSAAGVKCSFVTVAADQAEPERFSHVYVAAYPNGQRLPMDTSHGPHVGWETQQITRIEEWPVAGTQDITALAIVAAIWLWWRKK
jgi:hypothetical protein